MRYPTLLLRVVTALFSLCLTGFAFADGKPFRVGVTPGPHAQIMEAVQIEAAKEGLKIEIFEFSNYITPNRALADGEIDANSFQHGPYLENQVKNHGLDLISAGDTVLFPMGVYSKKITSLDDLRVGAVVGIPNDPSNGGRALLLLQDLGIIKLDPNAGILAMSSDIVENPKKISIIELEALQMPHALVDFDIGIINTNYAVSAGLDPNKDAIATEKVDSPYVNILAIRAKDKDSKEVAILMRAYHSPEVKAFIAETFKGSMIPAW